MLFTWLVSGLLVWVLIPGLNFLGALMIAACFTPTEPEESWYCFLDVCQWPCLYTYLFQHFIFCVAVFFGWFGPIGEGAIFYYTVAIEAIPENGTNAHARSLIKPVIYFMVLASVVALGITVSLGNLVKRPFTDTSSQIMLDKIIDTLEGIQENASKGHATVTIRKLLQAPENMYAFQKYNSDYEYRHKIPIDCESTLFVHCGAYQLSTSNEGMAHRRKSHAT